MLPCVTAGLAVKVIAGYCAGGWPCTPNIAAQQIIAPVETRTRDVALDSGALCLFGVSLSGLSLFSPLAML